MASVQNQGVRIDYETEGEGVPLVLLHGFAGDSNDWRRNGYVERLKESYLLILLDERGHGTSDKPHDSASYNLKQRVSDVTAVLEDLGIEKSHFMGYSMGGEVCFGIAQYDPERALSLIIGGMSPYPPDHPEAYDEQIQVLEKGMEAAVEAWGVSPENDPEALIASTLMARDGSGCGDILPQMRMPCLIYAGEADLYMYPAVKRCVRHIPEARFISLSGLDHGQAYSRSDLILPYVRRFLSQVDRVK